MGGKWLHAHCLRDFNTLLPWFQEEMTSALATMRVDYDQVKIKDLKTSNNRLLNKRRKKQKQAGTSSAAPGCNNQWEEKPRTFGWRVEVKRNNWKSVWSTQSVPQIWAMRSRRSYPAKREQCEWLHFSNLNRGFAFQVLTYMTWFYCILLGKGQ